MWDFQPIKTSTLEGLFEALLKKGCDQKLHVCFQMKDIWLEISKVDMICLRTKDKSFEMYIYKEEGKFWGALETVKSAVDFTGTFLVELSIKLARALSLVGIKLIDRSKVMNGVFAEKLVLIRAFQGKYSSWYETFGFVFQREKDRVLLCQSLKDLHDLSVPEISAEECLGSYMLRIRDKSSEMYKNTYKELNRNPSFQQVLNRIVKSLRRDLIYWVPDEMNSKI